MPENHAAAGATQLQIEQLAAAIRLALGLEEQLQNLSDRLASLEQAWEDSCPTEWRSTAQVAAELGLSVEALGHWARSHPIGSIRPDGWQLLGRVGQSPRSGWRWRRAREPLRSEV